MSFLKRSHIAIVRMGSDLVVPEIRKHLHHTIQLFIRVETILIHKLRFQCGVVDSCHRSIIIRAADTTHALRNSTITAVDYKFKRSKRISLICV